MVSGDLFLEEQAIQHIPPELKEWGQPLINWICAKEFGRPVIWVSTSHPLQIPSIEILEFLTRGTLDKYIMIAAQEGGWGMPMAWPPGYETEYCQKGCSHIEHDYFIWANNYAQTMSELNRTCGVYETHTSAEILKLHEKDWDYWKTGEYHQAFMELLSDRFLNLDGVSKANVFKSLWFDQYYEIIRVPDWCLSESGNEFIGTEEEFQAFVLNEKDPPPHIVFYILMTVGKLLVLYVASKYWKGGMISPDDFV